MTELHQWAFAQLGSPFRWGETDCCALALQAMQEIDGGDHAKVATWRTIDEARAVLRQTRPTRYLQAAGWVLADRPKSGDIITAPADGWIDGVHVCFGEASLTSSIRHGVVYTLTAPLIYMGGVVWRAPCRKHSL